MISYQIKANGRSYFEWSDDRVQKGLIQLKEQGKGKVKVSGARPGKVTWSSTRYCGPCFLVCPKSKLYEMLDVLCLGERNTGSFERKVCVSASVAVWGSF